MKKGDPKRLVSIVLPVAFGVVVLGGLFVLGYMRLTSLSSQVEQLGAELASTTALLSEETGLLTRNLSILDQKIVNVSNSVVNIGQALQSSIGEFHETVGEISGTVDTLNKLSKTDPELLQKYSKVYFLNEHYVPELLNKIPSEYLYSDRTQGQIHAQVWPHLKALLDAAKAEGMAIYIESAYRSFEEQKSLKSSYRVTYGAGTANQFSADQGYSEHQLGTTVDFITTGLGGQPEGFEKTSSYQWLLNNAHKYGFVLSYYQGNPYYIFEPWHWRYVGVELAAYLRSVNKHFYDLEQREIDAYLVNIFN
jgi:LAS superfamily LD-carboxypeptidase LdcB